METGFLFNGSIATLQRIDSLLVYSHAANIRYRVDLMQSLLIELYKEVYPFLNPNERKEGQNHYVTINNLSDKTPDEARFILNDFDFYIRMMLHNKGLLMAKGDDPGRAFK